MQPEQSSASAVADCHYRRSIDGDQGRGIAVCALLQEISRVSDDSLCHVPADACEVCCQSPSPSPDTINQVIASFLYQVGLAVIQAGGLPECTVEEAVQLKAQAFANLRWQQGSNATPPAQKCFAPPERFRNNGHTYSCDIVCCCSDSSPDTERALRSVLDQAGAVTHVHLVDNGGGGRQLAERYAGCGNVSVHRNPVPKSPLRTVHDLTGRMSTEFIAIQDPRTVSRPFRVSYSVGLLEEYGGDVLGATLRTDVGDVRPVEPVQAYARFLPAETLVFRRASFVDLGGVADRYGDDDAELVYRAYHESRSILLAPSATVQSQGPHRQSALGTPPDYQPQNGTLAHHGLGFPVGRVACDVVLPFWSQLDHVRQALESLLSQENAEVVIHLVDDGSPEDTQSFLRYWSSHRQVRAYRNERNLSQFTSFNNVSPYFETSLVAVQDGDDISLPGRISLAGNVLRQSRADIFGSSVVIFDEGESLDERGWGNLLPDIRVRRWKNIGISAWPTPMVYWFLFNPSMVLRTDAFRQLGGFGDFGSAVRNRCGHDIEFCLRAYHYGTRFAISRRPTVLYRQHSHQTTRNPITGFGTEHEISTSQESRRRGEIYRKTHFDPIAFGALGKYQHLTHRFDLGMAEK